jgi:hypothetical protein
VLLPSNSLLVQGGDKVPDIDSRISQAGAIKIHERDLALVHQKLAWFAVAMDARERV